MEDRPSYIICFNCRAIPHRKKDCSYCKGMGVLHEDGTRVDRKPSTYKADEKEDGAGSKNWKRNKQAYKP